MNSKEGDLLLSSTTISVDLVKKILKLIKNGSSLSTVWLPGSGRSRFGQFLQNTENLSRILGAEVDLDNQIFVYIDQNIGDTLTEYLNTIFLQHSEEANYRKAILTLTKQEKKICFVIDNAILDKDFLSWISSIRAINIDKVTYMLLSLQRDFEDMRDHLAHGFGFLQQNIIEIPYLALENSQLWLRIQSKSLDIKLNKELEDKIINWAGGVPAILKSSLRLLEKYNMKWELVITSEEMNSLIKSIWNRYSDELKTNILSFKLNSQKKIVDKYLQEMNITDGMTLRGDWFNNILHSLSNEPEIIIKDGIINYHSVNISELLSDRENAILLLLCSQKIITREEIFELTKDKEYSDWAIDKTMSRLRSKLEPIFLRKNIIKTIKDKGYKLDTVKISKK